MHHSLHRHPEEAAERGRLEGWSRINAGFPLVSVMAGLGPAIHDFLFPIAQNRGCPAQGRA